jgi:hypothetical protein
MEAASGRTSWGRFLLASAAILPLGNSLQCFKVVLWQFDFPFAPAPSPAIAFNAAEKTLTVVVDFD